MADSTGRWIAVAWLGVLQFITVPNALFSLFDHLDKWHPGWRPRTLDMRMPALLVYLLHPDTIELIFRLSVLAAIWITAREIKRMYRDGVGGDPNTSGWRG